MRNDELDTFRHELSDLERIVQQMSELQARQIDRERNVPGTDPDELLAIDADLAAARGITRKLLDLQGSLRSRAAQ